MFKVKILTDDIITWIFNAIIHNRSIRAFISNCKMTRLKTLDEIAPSSQNYELIIINESQYDLHKLANIYKQTPQCLFIIRGKPHNVCPQNVIGYFTKKTEFITTLTHFMNLMEILNKIDLNKHESIYASEVLFIQIKNRNLIIKTIKSEMNLGYKNLSSFLDKLDSKFLKINRYQIVNTRYIVKMYDNHLTLVDNSILKCSKNRIKNIQTLIHH